MKMQTRHQHWRNALLLALAMPIIIAVVDLIGAAMWHSIGGWEGWAYTTAFWEYQRLLWTSMYLLIIAIAGVWYLATKDKSESLALLIIPFVLLQFGAEDAFFYLLGGHEFWTVTMPWLDGNLWIPTILSRVLGYEVVNGVTIFFSTILGYLAALKINDYLWRKQW